MIKKPVKKVTKKKKPSKKIETIELPYCEDCDIISIRWEQSVNKAQGISYRRYNPVESCNEEVDFTHIPDTSDEIEEEFCDCCGDPVYDHVDVPVKDLNKLLNSLSPKDKEKLYEDGIPMEYDYAEKDSFNIEKAIKVIMPIKKK